MTQDSSRPYIGGQAVIEGVMMRSPGSLSVVCRRRSGDLVVREEPVAARPVGLRTYPFVRGVVTLVESLKLGSRALHWSAELYEADAAQNDDSGQPRSPPPGIMMASVLGVAALAVQDSDQGPTPLAEASKQGWLMRALPILFAVGLFVALPQAGAEGLNKLFHMGLAVTSPGFQAITGVSKLCVVVGFLLLIRRMPEVRRMFEYHGAEHKAISTYEARQDLRVENARRMTTLHPRCGTTFLVMIALVSILVFTVAGAFLPHVTGGRLVENASFFLMKLPFLPVVAAVTFELQRIFARYCTTGPLRLLLWPGFLVQKITTAEPDNAQLEVALASLRATLWREAAIDAPSPADRTFASYSELLADPGYGRS